MIVIYFFALYYYSEMFKMGTSFQHLAGSCKSSYGIVYENQNEPIVYLQL